jgi:teichuronic acid biosynthesis glycosyltransferase TuaH
VPAYRAAIDVGITPYTESDFNRASFPLKTLEYLAAGRPVVSTDLPGARWLLEDLARAGLAVAGQGPAEIMTLASTPAEFVKAVRRMVPGPDAEREQARRELCRAFATRHTWAHRADALAAAIGFTPAEAQPRPGSHVP